MVWLLGKNSIVASENVKAIFKSLGVSFLADFKALEKEVMHLRAIFNEFDQLRQKLNELLERPTENKLEYLKLSLKKLKGMVRKVTDENRSVKKLLSVIRGYMGKAEALVEGIEEETSSKKQAA